MTTRPSNYEGLAFVDDDEANLHSSVIVRTHADHEIDGDVKRGPALLTAAGASAACVLRIHNLKQLEEIQVMRTTLSKLETLYGAG